MKKAGRLTTTIQLFSAIVLLLLSSCKKDSGLDSKELLIYVQGDFGSTNNSIVASLTQTPVGVRGNTSFRVPVYATRGVAADVTVDISADEGSVDQFNLANKKKCLLMPAGSYTIDLRQLTIGKDSAESQPLTINISNPSLLTDTNGYVLPLTVKKLTGKDKGIAISTNRATVYLYVPYAFTNVDTTQMPLAGTTADRSGWSVTVSNTTSGALGPAMLDGSNTTAWRSSNSSTAVKWAILNCGGLQSIRGLVLTPDYVSTGENPTQITVSTSADNITWTVQGIWKGTGPVAGSSAASPDFKGINFIAPVQAQYFRLDINSWVSGSRAGIGELNAVQ